MTARRVQLLVLFLAVVSSASDAHADAAYYEHINATPIIRLNWTASSSGFYTFETTDLHYLPGCMQLCPANTFMVVSSPDGNEYYNDDHQGTARSSVTVYGPPGTYTVTVFANNPGGGGYTDVRVTDGWTFNTTLANDRRFGGRILQPSFLPLDLYKIQTAHNVDGALATRLIVYDSNWQERSYGAANDGIGLAAESITTFSYAAGDRIVVGSTNTSAMGSTAVIFDSCTSSPDEEPLGCGTVDDRDHDSLSNDLEALLGTDPDDLDTDNDGLYDYYEVIGRRLPSGGFGFDEVALRNFGADPLTRDMFIEVDVRSTAPVLNEFYAEQIQDPYDHIPSLPPNPSGTQRIAIHADIGVPCSASNAATGLPFADGSEYLALFYPDGGQDNWSRIYVGPLGPGISGFSAQKAQWFSQASTTAAYPAHSLGLVRRGDVAAVAYTSLMEGNPSVGWHVPYGNGIPPWSPALHTDWDDGATVDRNMCAVWCMVGGDRCDDPLASAGSDESNRCGDDAPTGQCKLSGAGDPECLGF